MAIQVTLELPEELARRARATAAQSQRRMEDVLVEWIDRAASESAIEALPDDQVLVLCDSQLQVGEQESLSALLARNRDGPLTPPEREQLDALMQSYRRGLVRKAQALKTAVARGLRPRLRQRREAAKL